MTGDLDAKILEFLESSTVDDSFKGIFRFSLPYLSEEQKKETLETLVAEQRGLRVLQAKDAQIEQKYKLIFERVGRKK